jgi:glycogen operon protein
MTDEDWFAPASTLGMFLNGQEILERDARGEPVVGDSFLLIAHSGFRPAAFTLPAARWATAYELLLDTSVEPPAGAEAAGPVEGTASVAAGSVVTVAERSVRLYRACGGGEE